MTVAELLARCRAQVGHKTRHVEEDEQHDRAIYQMGGGTLDVDAPHPWGYAEDGPCDCSAAVSWAVKIRKLQPGGNWMNTDGIWSDARKPGGLYSIIDRATPGAIIVYPSARTSHMPGPLVGHVGIVFEADAEGSASKVWHCSKGNQERFGDAIAITGSGVFRQWKATILAWAHTIEREEPCVASI